MSHRFAIYISLFIILFITYYLFPLLIRRVQPSNNLVGRVTIDWKMSHLYTLNCTQFGPQCNSGMYALQYTIHRQSKLHVDEQVVK